MQKSSPVGVPLLCAVMLQGPRQRTRPFKEPLRVLVAGVPQQLTTLTGACTGLSLLLASDSIPFGTVVLGSRTTKRMQLSNVGDVGCRFAWDTAALGREFSISPAGGEPLPCTTGFAALHGAWQLRKLT